MKICQNLKKQSIFKQKEIGIQKLMKIIFKSYMHEKHFGEEIA
jgi:hypothetical protein